MKMSRPECGLLCAVLLLSAAKAGGGDPSTDLAPLERPLNTTGSGRATVRRTSVTTRCANPGTCRCSPLGTSVHAAPLFAAQFLQPDNDAHSVHGLLA